MEKHQAYFQMAEHYHDNAYNQILIPADRAFNSCLASEFYLKTLHYQYYPNREIKGHISRRLLDLICDELQIVPPQTVIEAAQDLLPHYLAARYPENTSEMFACCINEEIAVERYTTINLREILEYMETIKEWVHSYLRI